GIQAPANLNTGRERRLKARNGKADEAGEGADPRNLHGPLREPVLLEMSFDPIYQGVALGGGQRAWKKLHHARIGVHLGKRWPITGLPAPEVESVRPKLLGSMHPGESPDHSGWPWSSAAGDRTVCSRTWLSPGWLDKRLQSLQLGLELV